MQALSNWRNLHLYALYSFDLLILLLRHSLLTLHGLVALFHMSHFTKRVFYRRRDGLFCRHVPAQMSGVAEFTLDDKDVLPKMSLLALIAQHHVVDALQAICHGKVGKTGRHTSTLLIWITS